MGSCFSTEEQQRSNQIRREQRKHESDQKKVKKLLLLGAGGSGKSTFFKQLRILHGTGISAMEMEHTYKDIVYSNILTAMQTLLENCTDMNGNLTLSIEKNYDFAEYINSIDEDSFEKNRSAIEAAIFNLWQDESIQETWERRSNFQIQDSARHFFDNINRICEVSYSPTDQDVLLARIRTTGIVEQEFVVKGNKFQVFDVGGQRNERKKWIHCFEKVTGVLFLASLAAYDQTLYEDDQTNRMKEALTLFHQICNSRWFKDTAMILFLNKLDLFEDKIKKIPITVCFKDYKGQPGDDLEARDFIREQFKAKNLPIKNAKGHNKKKPLFIHYTCAIDRGQVDKIFKDVQNVIIHANLEKAALI